MLKVKCYKKYNNNNKTWLNVLFLYLLGQSCAKKEFSNLKDLVKKFLGYAGNVISVYNQHNITRVYQITQ